MRKKNFNFDFIGKTKLFLTISVVMIAISILSSFVFGVNVDIQFKGGTLITYIFDGDIDTSEFEKAAEDALGGIGVSTTTGTDFATGKNNIQVSLLSNSGLTSENQFNLTNALTDKYADNNLVLLESSDISPSSGKVFFLKCLVAVIFSAIVLIIYIALRFKNIGGLLGGFCAVAALIHDCIIVYGSFVILGMSINANFMAVILTILGYSINNTIVIYDRIRENETLFRKVKTHTEIVNMSINQSLTRSINTSLTTIFAMLAVTVVAALYGVESIISFSLPMMIGMIVGTYSSVCVTCPFWLVLKGLKKDTKKGSKKTVKA